MALGVNEGAYMAEIVRAGIEAIDPGQLEAAKSLGMTYGLSMQRIVLPQAAKVIIDRQAGAADLYLFFPKEEAGGHVITPEDEEVEVVVKLESQTIKRKFKLSEMMYEGKLEM